jgi:hypothetical protein
VNFQGILEKHLNNYYFLENIGIEDYQTHKYRYAFFRLAADENDSRAFQVNHLSFY